MQFIYGTILNQVSQLIAVNLLTVMNVVTQQLVHRNIQYISQMNNCRQAKLSITGFYIADMRR